MGSFSSVELAQQSAWRRGQWASVEAFLRGEGRKRVVGPGMEDSEDGTNNGRVLEHPDLARLDRTLR